MSTVTYKPIEGFPDYRIGNDGTVWKWYKGDKRRKDKPPRWKQFRPFCANGSLLIGLTCEIDGRRYTKSVARLVLSHFVGPRPMGCESMHFPDPDRTNNRAENLRWVPRGTTLLGRETKTWGETNGCAKLSERDVVRIRTMAESGFGQTELAERFSIDQVTVSRIVRGRSWKKAGGPISRSNQPLGSKNSLSKLEEKDIPTIRHLLATGECVANIARRYGLNRNTIYRIKHGKTWSHVPDSPP